MEKKERKLPQQNLKENGRSLKKLNIKDLLEVQGGLDSYEFMRDCSSYQCTSYATICHNNQ